MAEVISRRSIIYDIVFDVSQGKKGINEATDAIEGATQKTNTFNDSLQNVGKTASSGKVNGAVRELKKQIVSLGLENTKLAQIVLKSEQDLRKAGAAQKAYSLVVGASTGAMKLFRVALALTGIGAFAIALGTVIVNFDKIKKAVTNTFPVLNKLGSIAKGLKDGFIETFRVIGDTALELFKGNLGGAVDEAFRAGERIGEAFNEGFTKNEDEKQKLISDKIIQRQQEQAKLQIRLLEAQGKDTFELHKTILENEIKLLDKSAEDFKERERELKTEIIAITIERNRELAEERKKNKKDVVANIELELDLIKAAELAITATTIEESDKRNEEREKEIETLFRLQDAYKAYLASIGKSVAVDPSIKKALERIAIEEQVQEATINAAQTTFDSVRDIVGQQYSFEVAALDEKLKNQQISQEEYNKRIAALNEEKAKNDLAFTLTEIAINSGLAISKAVAAAQDVGFPAAIPATIAAIASVLAGISKAVAAVRNVQALAEGTEYVDGKGTETSDSIPARLSRGEAVITAKQNRKYDGLSKAMLDDNVDNWVKKNYIDPNLAVTAMDSAIKDSRTIDYSDRFYRQYLATNETNYSAKKMTSYLASIDSKLSETKYAKWYGRT